MQHYDDLEKHQVIATFYDSPNDYRNYLKHHGVKGMKWGVRHEEKRKAKAMKKYNISSEDYDKAKQIAKVKSEPARHVLKTVGKIVGGAHGLGAGIGLGTAVAGTAAFEGGMSAAAAAALGVALGPALTIPLGVAAGSAIFGVGANILEGAMRNEAMGERQLQLQNDMYNDIRTKNVRQLS